MKAIILTLSTGNGHHIASNSIKDYLVSKGVDATVIDAYKYFSKCLSKIIEKGYVWGAKYTPYMYGKFYDSIERHNPESQMSWSRFCNGLVASKFGKYISKQNPDIVISTHPLAAVLMTTYKRKQLVNTKTIGIVTDFCILPYWDMADMDYFVTANDDVKYMLEKKGIASEKILPYGIPINGKFAKKMSKEEARKQLGIEDKTTLFVMSGSMGFGNTEDYISMLDRMEGDFQIVNVCGSNKSMKNRIDRMRTLKKIYNYGYVDNVDIIMDASDIMITKPGGLSASEAIAKNLPMILINPIPGQEDRNKEYLVNSGMATGVSNNLPIDVIVNMLLNNKEKRNQILAMQQMIGRPNASEDIGNFIINFTKEE